MFCSGVQISPRGRILTRPHTHWHFEAVDIVALSFDWFRTLPEGRQVPEDAMADQVLVSISSCILRSAVCASDASLDMASAWTTAMHGQLQPLVRPPVPLPVPLRPPPVALAAAVWVAPSRGLRQRAFSGVSHVVHATEWPPTPCAGASMLLSTQQRLCMPPVAMSSLHAAHGLTWGLVMERRFSMHAAHGPVWGLVMERRFRCALCLNCSCHAV